MTRPKKRKKPSESGAEKPKAEPAASNQRQELSNVSRIMARQGLRPDLVEKIEAVPGAVTDGIDPINHRELLREVGSTMSRFGGASSWVEAVEEMLGEKLPEKIKLEPVPLSSEEESLRWWDLQGNPQWRERVHRLNVAITNLMSASESTPVGEQVILSEAVSHAHRELNSCLTELIATAVQFGRDSKPPHRLRKTMQGDLALWTGFSSVRERLGDPELKKKLVSELGEINDLLDDLRMMWASARRSRAESARRHRVEAINKAQSQVAESIPKMTASARRREARHAKIREKLGGPEWQGRTKKWAADAVGVSERQFTRDLVTLGLEWTS